MKFGILMHKNTQNIGDDIQSFAVANLLPSVDYFLDRENMDTFKTEDGKPVAVVMSAWYMFSAFGFYPVNPASGEYVLGAPQIKRAKLNLRGGKTFEIKADNLSKENKYVKSIRLNGKDISGRKTITYAEIMAGGILEFDMSNR